MARTRKPRQTKRLDEAFLKAYDRPRVLAKGKLAGCRDFRNPQSLIRNISTTSPGTIRGSDGPTHVELRATVLAEENAENSRIY